MDFDDLLLNTHVILEKFPEVLYKYQHKFRYVLIDEFQDTNSLQYSIVKRIADVFQNITVVGDDAQSIYAFRGATIDNILNFEKDFPELKVYKLEQNYRSTQNIVKAANELIHRNKNQLKKEIWTQNDKGEHIKLVRTPSDNEEGRWVCRFHYGIEVARTIPQSPVCYFVSLPTRKAVRLKKHCAGKISPTAFTAA